MPDSNQNPIVSVIVPCYNHGRFLAETLRSVMEQIFGDWECIVVDNGSMDNTKAVVHDFVARDERFKYIYQEQKGVSSARNNGIRSSSGKYILPLDADDRIGSAYISEAIRILESNPFVRIVYCDAELFGDMNGKWKLIDFSMKNMLMENVIFCSALYRRCDYDKTNGYNEKMLKGLEDWDFWIELLENGGEVYKIPQVNFYYRIKKGSRNGQLTEEEVRVLRKEIYHNHKALYEKYFDTSDALFEWYLKNKAFREIELSKEFRLGKILLRPLRRIKSMFAR